MLFEKGIIDIARDLAFACAARVVLCVLKHLVFLGFNYTQEELLGKFQSIAREGKAIIDYLYKIEEAIANKKMSWGCDARSLKQFLLEAPRENLLHICWPFKHRRGN